MCLFKQSIWTNRLVESSRYSNGANRVSTMPSTRERWKCLLFWTHGATSVYISNSFCSPLFSCIECLVSKMIDVTFYELLKSEVSFEAFQTSSVWSSTSEMYVHLCTSKASCSPLSNAQQGTVYNLLDKIFQFWSDDKLTFVAANSELIERATDTKWKSISVYLLNKIYYFYLFGHLSINFTVTGTKNKWKSNQW